MEEIFCCIHRTIVDDSEVPSRTLHMNHSKQYVSFWYLFSVFIFVKYKICLPIFKRVFSCCPMKAGNEFRRRTQMFCITRGNDIIQQSSIPITSYFSTTNQIIGSVSDNDDYVGKTNRRNKTLSSIFTIILNEIN